MIKMKKNVLLSRIDPSLDAVSRTYPVDTVPIACTNQTHLPVSLLEMRASGRTQCHYNV